MEDEIFTFSIAVTEKPIEVNFNESLRAYVDYHIEEFYDNHEFEYDAL